MFIGCNDAPLSNGDRTCDCCDLCPETTRENKLCKCCQFCDVTDPVDTVITDPVDTTIVDPVDPPVDSICQDVTTFHCGETGAPQVKAKVINGRCNAGECRITTQGNYYYNITDIRELSNAVGIIEVDALIKTNGCKLPNIDVVQGEPGSYCYRQTIDFKFAVGSSAEAEVILTDIMNELELRKVITPGFCNCPAD